MKPDEFQCDLCHGIFPKEWSDAEMDAESAELFGDIPPGDAAVVCDGCFVAMFGEPSPLMRKRDEGKR